MTQARKTIISIDDTPYYHCMSRCVRRAFLCGVDAYSGINYEHRRQWLENKLHQVASVFAIKLCAYAVMSNHYHVVLHVRNDIAQGWSIKEVAERWHSLFSGNFLSHKLLSNSVLTDSELTLLTKDIQLWRSRMCDISWFMRIVNESIARQANQEDQCSGRFWEGRFKSQALLDKKALLSCMAYVDLNPIRAAIATTPETSEFTSIHARIVANQTKKTLPNTLETFTGQNSEQIGLPFQLLDYLNLVDWTGRIIREDKRGSIDSDLPPILQRLALSSNSWAILTSHFESQFSHWVGSEDIVRKTYDNKGYQRTPSTKNFKTLFG